MITQRGKEMDLETLKQAKPYIRSILAFLLKLRVPTNPATSCYCDADDFISQLERDVKDA